jgi:ABC-type polysaccharide/polyol phosphate transport system ATPase subunit
MTKPSISIRNVFKRFRRGEQKDSLRDLVASWMRGPGRKPPSINDFFALSDVSFDVQPGEAFGIVGPNGAGKSTMLKLLAGIMRPTSGVIDVIGRVSALIELGAGFHGDLTGRENIFLNASILGIPRTEVRRKFNDIAEFADIGDFLDTPLKRYSSGMHARLGFAIAAHADPQVLLVDEVLSVGDRVFRAKCLDKMKSFLKKGVAIVFVSHDLGTVNRFCNRTMVLDRGKPLFVGSSSNAIGLYYDACSQSLVARSECGEAQVLVSNIEVLDMAGRAISTARPGERIRFTFDLEFKVAMAHPSYGLSLIRSDDHLTMFESSSTRLGFTSEPIEAGQSRSVTYELDLNVSPGQYALGLHVRDRDALEYAVEMAYADSILVNSDAQSGGLTHVNPWVAVTEPARDQRRRKEVLV